MTRGEWADLYDQLLKRQCTGEDTWVMTRDGGNTHQFRPKYTSNQNRRWFLDQLKKRGLIDA